MYDWKDAIRYPKEAVQKSLQYISVLRKFRERERNLTGKKSVWVATMFHNKEVSQQRSPSKEVSQQRGLTAKKPHSEEVSDKLWFQKFQLQFLREVPHESLALPSCSCKFRGKSGTKALMFMYTCGLGRISRTKRFSHCTLFSWGAAIRTG